jgi:hypothetical protein
MGDFKFACPSCGQRILANDNYAGYKINCPTCQTAIVVPAKPAAPSSIGVAAQGAPPPQAPPTATRSGVSAVSSAPARTSAPVPNPEPEGSAALQAHMAGRRHKSYSALIAGVAAVTLIGLSVYVGRDWLAGKWKALHGASAAGNAATNRPPHPPAEPSVAEIWQKVIATYKELKSLSATGATYLVADPPQGSAATTSARTRPPVSLDLTAKLGRPDHYRIEWTDHRYTNIGWSAGQGNFHTSGDGLSHKESSRSIVTGVLAGDGFALATGLFFNNVRGMPAYIGTDWSQTNGAAIPGQPCYILAGTVFFQKSLIWVNKQTFLIQQLQVVLDGNTNPPGMDDAKIKAALTAMNSGQAATPADITDFKKEWTGMVGGSKGTMTETYQNIQTNVPIALAEFEPEPTAPPPAGRLPETGGDLVFPYANRITSMTWGGEDFQPRYSGELKVKETYLGPTDFEDFRDVLGLAFHPDGRIGISVGRGSTPNMSLYYRNQSGVLSPLVKFQYDQKATDADEERGVFSFFAGELAFDRAGNCLFTRGNGSGDSVYKVLSTSPVLIDKLRPVDGLLTSLQIPYFDDIHVYVTSTPNVYRFDQEKAGPGSRVSADPWFRLSDKDMDLVETLLISPTKLILELRIRPVGESSNFKFDYKTLLLDRESKVYWMLSTDYIGPMAMSWDGKRLIRVAANKPAIMEFSLPDLTHNSESAHK